MNQQEQYHKDIKALDGTGHEAWELWERMMFFDGYWDTCTYEPEFNLVFVKYRRRPDADEMIKAWQKQKNDTITIPRTLLAEIVEIAERDQKTLEEIYEDQVKLNLLIAKAKELI